MIQTKNMIAAAVLAALPVFAGTNLVPNPGFEQERNEGWRYGGVFGGAKGFVRVTRNEAAAGKQAGNLGKRAGMVFHQHGGRRRGADFCAAQSSAVEQCAECSRSSFVPL